MNASFLTKGSELYLIIMMVFGCGSILSSGARSSGLCINKGAVVQNPADGVCGNMDIRNQLSNFRKLENCTVIEGSLHIMFIDRAGKDFEDYSFPLLREITDYLMLYRVIGLKSLRHLFPNLAVIRGQKLFYNYALVAFEMRDLEELGLVNLRIIMRGAARLTKNKKLCYIDTIDWGRIATGVEPSAHHFMDNKDAHQCVNYCPEVCPTTLYNGVDSKRCWTGKDCQKNLNCMCTKNTSCMDDDARTCCHEYCLGGCTKPYADSCFACKGVVYDGKCQLVCPTGTYKFAKRRCLTDVECLNLRNRTDNVDGKKSMLLQEQKKCVMSCPKGYTVAKKGKLKDMECVKCDGFCPKECNSTIVNSIQDAQRLQGCSKIIGPLIIQIMGGSNVAEELGNNLGDIREVTGFINIRQSYALLNLHFFKSLEIIEGEQLAHQGNSLIVMDNSNLQELFPEDNMRKMKIKKGKVSFHSNRKLCKYKIDEFVSHLNLPEPPTEQDISPVTNGDLKPCMKQELKLDVSIIHHNAAILEWDKDKGDERNLLTYMINYKEIKDKNVNIHQGRDACSDDVWTIKEQQPADTPGDRQLGLLPRLKPYTMYAVYVQAYTLSTATHSAMTNVQTFITNPYYPSEPRDLKVTANSPSELRVAWKPPTSPNGNVTHYRLAYLKQTINPELFEQRNYCVDPVLPPKKKIIPKEEEKEKSTNRSANCCTCPKSKEELAAEARKKEIEVYFENYLQNNIYCKRYDELPDGVDPDGFGYTIDELADSDLIRNKTMVSQKPPYDWMDQLNERLKRTKVENDSRNYDDTLIGTVEVFGLEAVIGNLDPFSEYIIEVQACHNTNTGIQTKLCSNQAITAGRTKAIWKLDMINESTIASEAVTNTSGDILIKWDPPSNPNGLILMYNVFYKRTRSNQQNIVPQQICIRQSQYRTYNGCRLAGLEPGNWTFQINAVSLAGNLSKTSEHYFIIPNPPGNDDSNYIFIIIIIIVIPASIICIVLVVWGFAKNKFRHEDMTVISQNINYVPSEPIYVMDGWEVERDKIKLVRELGQGSFGMVYEGTAIGLGDDPEEEIRVAVKTVNDRANFNDRREFLKEATTMKAFDCYHVVKLLGVVSHGQPALVIMELMALGDLKNYLREHRPDEAHINPPRLLDILQMAGEIADGMAYLAAKKFVHRDLAARNCMVDEDKIVKIGDFGMTRDIYETDYYRKGGKGMLPVRWMAPESLKDGVFTTMSDVWSYGVVMWEMVTLAAQPYQGLSNEGVVKFVSNGNTMDVPDNCPEEMSLLMERCWARRPKNRPTFMEIIEYLLPHLNTRFNKVSYFFNEGGGPVDEGHGGILRQPADEGEEEQAHVADGNVGDGLSDSASSLEGASAPPMRASCEHDYPVDRFQVNFLYGRDQNSVMHRPDNSSFPLFSELPENSHKNTCYDSNLDGSFEGESFTSDGDDACAESDSNRSFIRGDYQSVPLNMPHSLPTSPLSKENNDGPTSEPSSGVIELQPLISCDEPSSSIPFSLPSPNSDQSKAISAPKYSGYQSVPQGADGHFGTSSKSQSSSHQKPQLTSAFPLTHARMDRPVPHNGSGTSALRPSQSLGASSSSSSLSSPSSVPPLLPAASNAPSRPSLRLPVLNQPPGGGFHRVPLFNSGSKDKNDSQRNRDNCQPTSSGDSFNLPGTDRVQGENQQKITDSPLIVHSSISPHQGTLDSTSSDGSKESNKSAENFSQMKGLTNGFVWHKTAPC